MAKLILSLDGLVLKEIPLARERMSIGRKPHNDIRIDNLAISGEHAAIVTILGDSFLEDLGSTNGTRVNGQPIRKHVLQSGDVIELGKYQLQYLAAPPAPRAEAAAADEARLLRPPAEPPTPAPAAPPAAIPVIAALPAAIVRILDGANAGREFALTKALTTLGKPGVQVAAISRRPQGFFIAHVSGAPLPLINGRAPAVAAQPLADHDVIEVAGVRMEFLFQA